MFVNNMSRPVNFSAVQKLCRAAHAFGFQRR